MGQGNDVKDEKLRMEGKNAVLKFLEFWNAISIWYIHISKS